MNLPISQWKSGDKSPREGVSSSQNPGNGRKKQHNQKQNMPDLLSDQQLELIKDRIRKKYRSDTAKILTAYGLILVIFIWYVISHNFF